MDFNDRLFHSGLAFAALTLLACTSEGKDSTIPDSGTHETEDSFTDSGAPSCTEDAAGEFPAEVEWLILDGNDDTSSPSPMNHSPRPTKATRAPTT